MQAFSFISSLGWYWIAAPLAAAALGTAVFLRGIGHFFSGEAARGGARLIVGAPIALVGFALSLLGLNTQTYSRLSYESPVADVSVKAVDPAQNLYDVTVKRLDDGAAVQTCRIQGDEWEMSGRVQKWKPWANVLGLDTTYTLDQMSNKYSDAARGNGKPITACDLTGPPPAVDQWVPQSWLFWIADQSYVEDRRFGSASYMPLADGAVYRVVMTQAGLNAQPSNDSAAKANGAK
jgi:hypothetical protein